VASETAATTAGALLAGSPDVSEAIVGAKAAVAELARSGDPRRAASNPACTIVAATVRGAEINIGWVGDSRAYWLPPEGPAEQLTEDDSWATHAIAMGADPAAAMRDPKAHAITAWLGADAAPVLPRTGAFTVVGAGLLVLCSDGLWNYLTDPADFAQAVREELRAGGTLVEAARGLAEFANAAGGADNITVALIPVSSAPADIPDTVAEPAVKE
jgi:serine/threonine protein phosphatase PrpC